MKSDRERIKKEMLKRYDKNLLNNNKPSYFLNLEDNLMGYDMDARHKKMFESADGNELTDNGDKPAKAKAIDSSSMLAYIFFRWIDENNPLIIDGIRYVNVFFEVRYRTIYKGGKPANIDVVLLSEDGLTALFIESKFMEYLDEKKTQLPVSYLSENQYYPDNDEKEELYRISKKYQDEGKYNDGIKQIICHLIGISNLMRSKRAKELYKRINNKNTEFYEVLKVTNIKFLTILFEPLDHNAYEIFKSYREGLISHFENLKESCIYEYIHKKNIMTYQELYELLTYPEEYKKPLKEKYLLI